MAVLCSDTSKKTDTQITNGVRNDIITALKKLKDPQPAWPGAALQIPDHWKDGIGPKDKKGPLMVNQMVGRVQKDNSLGTHDFLNMCSRWCRTLSFRNVGSGTVQELQTGAVCQA